MDDPKAIEVALAQWQTCVEMSNSISQRRDTANNFFVMLNIALITAISYLREINSIVLTVSGIIFETGK